MSTRGIAFWHLCNAATLPLVVFTAVQVPRTWATLRASPMPSTRRSSPAAATASACATLPPCPAATIGPSGIDRNRYLRVSKRSREDEMQANHGQKRGNRRHTSQWLHRRASSCYI